jgi:hypothetical protein
MSKLVNRLRSRQESRYDGGSQDHGWYADELCQEAADEIEALRAKLAQYEQAEVEPTDAAILSIAMLLAGPHNPVPPSSPFSLEELREVRWDRHLDDAARWSFTSAAMALVEEYALIARPEVKE